MKNDKFTLFNIFFSERIGLVLSGIGLCLIIVIALIFITFGSWELSPILDEAKLGQFGDFIGGIVGSLFALAGVILYYVALKEQRKDIKINQDALNLQITALNQQVEESKAQKNELQETRRVYEEQTTLFREQTEYYKQQAKEYKNQALTSTLQQFDSSFYALLNVFINYKNELNSGKTGNSYFEDIYEKINAIDGINTHNIKEGCILVHKRYIQIFYQNSDALSLFYKTIYRLLKLINSANISEEAKTQYAKILRSQITNKELIALYYDYHSPLGEKARPLAIKYDLLKHIDVLDKIEICCKLGPLVKCELSAYIRSLAGIIKESIDRFKDIEQINDININESFDFIDLKSSFSIKISDQEFSVSIIFPIDVWKTQHIINENILQSIMLRCIYDILFMSKFKIPNGNELEKSIIENDKQHELKFSTNDITII